MITKLSDKMALTFYRIQRDGIGPYHLNNIKWQTTSHSDENHPIPEDDFHLSNNNSLSLDKSLDKELFKELSFAKEISFLFHNTDNALYCFESMNQLIEWFNLEEIYTLLTNNFEIIKIISSEYLLGNKQAIVHKKHFQLIDSISCWQEFETRGLDF